MSCIINTSKKINLIAVTNSRSSRKYIMLYYNNNDNNIYLAIQIIKHLM